jgi:hypothetical protein
MWIDPETNHSGDASLVISLINQRLHYLNDFAGYDELRALRKRIGVDQKLANPMCMCVC